MVLACKMEPKRQKIVEETRKRKEKRIKEYINEDNKNKGKKY